MNPISKTTGLLVLLGIAAVAEAPAMLATTGKHAPPPAAAFVNIAFGLATVAGAVGLTRGARWARRVTIGALGIRLVTGVLSLGAHIPMLLRAAGIVTFVASAVALVLVVRTRKQLALA